MVFIITHSGTISASGSDVVRINDIPDGWVVEQLILSVENTMHLIIEGIQNLNLSRITGTEAGGNQSRVRGVRFGGDIEIKRIEITSTDAEDLTTLGNIIFRYSEQSGSANDFYIFLMARPPKGE